MKRTGLLIACLLLFRGVSFTQKQGQVWIDSMMTVLKVSNEDTNRVNILNDLAWELKNKKLDTAIVLSTQALRLSERLKWQLGIVRAENNLGLFSENKGDHALALEHYSKAISICEELEKSGTSSKFIILKLKSGVISNTGAVYNDQGDKASALDYYFKALKIKEDIGYKLGQANTLGSIGIVYEEQSDYPKALDYYLKAMKIHEELGDKTGVANTLGNIGVVYRNEGDNAKALDYYFKSLKIKEDLGDKDAAGTTLGNIGNVYWKQSDYPNALDYYFKALKIAEEVGSKNGIERHLGNIGNVYNDQKNYPKALDYYQRSLKLAEELNYKKGIAINKGNIGALYIKQDKLKEADKFLQDAIKVATEIKALDLIQEQDEDLSQLYIKKGDWKKAFDYYKQAVTVRDSVNNEEKAKKQTRLEMKYEFEKKEDATRAEQDKKDALAKVELGKQKLVRNISIAGVIIVLCFGIYLIYSLGKRKELESKQSLLNERLRISRELHDDIGSTLGSIAIYSDVAKNRALKNENPSDTLSKIGSASRELVEKMSDIVWSLNPDNETFIQLQNRMQAFAAMMLTPCSILFDFKADDALHPLLLTSEQRKNIFLIYKETIYNIVKYADCKNVQIALAKLNDSFIITVKDDGKGFDIDNHAAYNGNGIKNMKARADDMKATLLISSKKNEGASVELIVGV